MAYYGGGQSSDPAQEIDDLPMGANGKPLPRFKMVSERQQIPGGMWDMVRVKRPMSKKERIAAGVRIQARVDEENNNPDAPATVPASAAVGRGTLAPGGSGVTYRSSAASAVAPQPAPTGETASRAAARAAFEQKMEQIEQDERDVAAAAAAAAAAPPPHRVSEVMVGIPPSSTTGEGGVDSVVIYATAFGDDEGNGVNVHAKRSSSSKVVGAYAEGDVVPLRGAMRRTPDGAWKASYVVTERGEITVGFVCVAKIDATGGFTPLLDAFSVTP